MPCAGWYSAAVTQLDTLFGLIQGAYTTLTDANKRGEFDAKRAMESQGMSTDVAALFEAENDIHKGRLLLDRGEMLAASKLFERARLANPGNREWEALLLYTKWWQRKDQLEGTTTVTQLEAIAKEMPSVVDVTYFAGHIANEVGNVKRAKTLLKRVLEEEPQHHGATRVLRAMAKVAEEEQKKAASAGGLMGRFLKR
jgi:tetratricopeptide (TPR) repeat protein